MDYRHVMETDPELFKAIADEVERQREHIELIASENFVSPAVMEAMGSPLTNKYAEGYPGQALLRRLPVRGRGGEPGPRPRQAALWRRTRQRAAPQRRAGQYGRLFCHAAAPAIRCWA